MSIIYDALKKIENLKKVRQPTDNQPTPPRAVRKITIYLGFALAMLCGYAIAGFFFKPILRLFHKGIHSEQTKLLQNPLDSSPAVLKTAPEPERKAASIQTLPGHKELPAAGQKSPETYVLNGVFFSQNVGFALINNKIVKENDTIGEMIVKKIGTEQVELERNGETILLSLYD